MSNDMVKIHFKGNTKCGHCFTISTLNLKAGYVIVYDLELDTQVKDQIGVMLKYECTIVTAKKVPVQQQHGSMDTLL